MGIILFTIFFSFIIFFFLYSNLKRKTKTEEPQLISLDEKPGSKGYLGMSLPANFKAFGPNCPWNTPIPKNPETDSFSELMINNLKYKAKVLKIDTKKWTIPLFVIDSKNSPKVDVKTTSIYLYYTVDPDENGIAEGIPIPEGVWPDPEKDGHMLLIDPKVRKSWDFSRAKKLPDGSWIASRIDVWDLNGPGFRDPFSGKYWWTSGARGSGFPLIAGLIRPEEIEAGEINHALVFASPINRKATFPEGKPQLCSPPASVTDGEEIGYEYIPEGARLQLDPALDIDSLNLSPATMVIVRAMQKYGMYNGDGSSDFKIYSQNLGPDGGIWSKYSYFDDLKNIPIERFRVLKCNLVSKP
ncbi:MAG: hypothetical protein UT63_C0086G0007 [Candidatus Gottesmanbacteria bacterium GW2011_GWC2_39_8]|uniref:Uncharacterized protein n=1 Tax=Candidatus Gottesmanbacteria bacterium GW2011_GWC2_39_8 TaxID=1618450 RepID=A0A0G0S8H3_9BACT|nr:MAG: hypothetical protein UT63_C0086G0007 [Candidatus Gottesmanbacteria bacterium GW2011_GWC2_39_8]